MNYAAMRRLGAALPWPDLPVLTRALPAVGSLLLLMAAGVALLFPKGWGVAALLLWTQLLLLAYGANRIAAVAHERLLPWERRLAPGAARERVRAWLLNRLGGLAALGMVGPLAIAAARDLHADELRWLPGVAALLSASLAGGLVLGLSWRGRAPRVLVLPAVMLLVQLLLMGGIKVVAGGDPLASLAILLGAGLLWCSLLPAGALAAVAPPLPRMRAPAWLKRPLGRMFLTGWSRVPYRSAAIDQFANLLLAISFVAMFSSFAVSKGWLRWGKPYDDAWMVGGYGLWLFLLAAAAAGFLMAPPLQWRLRLAPRGMTAQRWARGLVGGSMLFQVVLLGLAFGVAAATGKPSSRPDSGILASALGDLLLAVSLAAWLRGRTGSAWDGLRVLLGLVLAGVAVLAGLNALGVTPQRGAVWLLAQLALTVPITLLAIRAWARQDLNAMATSIVWTPYDPNKTGALNR